VGKKREKVRNFCQKMDGKLEKKKKNLKNGRKT
jgi:hypothetical protein